MRSDLAYDAKHVRPFHLHGDHEPSFRSIMWFTQRSSSPSSLHLLMKSRDAYGCFSAHGAHGASRSSRQPPLRQIPGVSRVA